MLAHINTYISHEFIWSVHTLLRFSALFYRPVLFQDYCCQIMTNPLVLVISCSDAQQTQSVIVAVWDLLRGKIPKAQQNNSNPGILFIFFSWVYGEGCHPSVHCVCLKWYSHVTGGIVGYHCLKCYSAPLETCLLLFPLNDLLLGLLTKGIILHCFVVLFAWTSYKNSPHI